MFVDVPTKMTWVKNANLMQITWVRHQEKQQQFPGILESLHVLMDLNSYTLASAVIVFFLLKISLFQATT